jgi:hypothetical protein
LVVVGRGWDNPGVGVKDDGMRAYPVSVEGTMKKFFDSLSEKDRRRYAAVEVAKLGHGGVEYVARVLGCDPKTIQQGSQELEQAQDAAAGRVRKKGVDASP